MVYSRTQDNPITAWVEVVTAGAELSLSGFEDALKEIENAMQYLSPRVPDSPVTNGSFMSLYTNLSGLSGLFSLNVGTEFNNETVRDFLDRFRSDLSLAVFPWGVNRILTPSVTLIDEIRRAIGLTTPEDEMNMVVGDKAGAVVKEFGTPDTYRFANVVGETAGSPFMTNGLKAVKRIVRFPEATRKANVESWLMFKHGGSGQWTGNQTFSIKLGNYDSGNAEVTYLSGSTVFASGLPTLEDITEDSFKITGYPTSGTGTVDLLIELDLDLTGSPTDGGNMFPLDFHIPLFADWPEIRLWQPESI